MSDPVQKRSSSKRGSAPLTVDDIDPAGTTRRADAASDAADKAVEESSRSSERDAAKKTERIVADATGWVTTASFMTVTCTKDGLAPVTMCRSSVAAAGKAIIEMLTDPNYVPMVRTAARKLADVAVVAPDDEII